MVIWSECHMRQYRDGDHRETRLTVRRVSPHFTAHVAFGPQALTLLLWKENFCSKLFSSASEQITDLDVSTSWTTR